MQTTLRPARRRVNEDAAPAPGACVRASGALSRRMDRPDPAYILDDQIGFVLRRVSQRHLAIFAEAIPDLTTTQFATLAKLAEHGPLSQNHLGRVTAMDGATIKGVVDRLRHAGLIVTTADALDRRRLTVALTAEGRQLFDRSVEPALAVSARTLAPLAPEDRARLMDFLLKLI